MSLNKSLVDKQLPCQLLTCLHSILYLHNTRSYFRNSENTSIEDIPGFRISKRMVDKMKAVMRSMSSYQIRKMTLFTLPELFRTSELYHISGVRTSVIWPLEK